MTAWASALAAVLLVASPAQLFRFQDEAIDESSGLVVSDDTMLTVNDPGDSARVFVVDRGSGETVGVTRYLDQDPVDVEAIAAAPGGRLFVGDIGDNDAVRDHVTVYEIALPSPGDREVTATAYDLVYEGGPEDAETLLVHPGTGRLYVVSKGLLGGTVFVAPRNLRADRTNVLVPFGSAGGLVTDGAFFPDGRHAVLRDYGSATVVSTRDFSPIGSFRLPDQEQGEGVSLLGDDVVVSSEGQHAPVLAVPIPGRVLRAMDAPTSSPSPTPSPSPSAAPSTASPGETAKQAAPFGGDVVPFALGAAWLVLVVLAVRAWRRRRRSG